MCYFVLFFYLIWTNRKVVLIFFISNIHLTVRKNTTQINSPRIYVFSNKNKAANHFDGRAVVDARPEEGIDVGRGCNNSTKEKKTTEKKKERKNKKKKRSHKH